MPEREITDGKTKTMGGKCSAAFALSIFTRFHSDDMTKKSVCVEYT